MKLFSSGQAANMLGVHRDKMTSLRRDRNSPKASMMIGNRNAYSMDDVMKLWRYLVDHKYPVRKPVFDAEETPACIQSNS